MGVGGDPNERIGGAHARRRAARRRVGFETLAQEAGVALVDLFEPRDRGGRIGEGLGCDPLRRQDVVRHWHGAYIEHFHIPCIPATIHQETTTAGIAPLPRAALRLLVLASLLAFAVALLAAPQASAGGRVALVIGNSAYKFAPRLNNSVNDASDIAAALERLGFDVVRGARSRLRRHARACAALQRAARGRRGRPVLLRRPRPAGGGPQLSRAGRRAARIGSGPRLRDHRSRSRAAQHDAREPHQHRVPRCLPRQSADGQPRPPARRALGRDQPRARAGGRPASARSSRLPPSPATWRSTASGRNSPFTAALLEHHRAARPACRRRDDCRAQPGAQADQRQAGALGPFLADRQVLFRAAIRAAARQDRRSRRRRRRSIRSTSSSRSGIRSGTAGMPACSRPISRAIRTAPSPTSRRSRSRSCELLPSSRRPNSRTTRP